MTFLKPSHSSLLVSASWSLFCCKMWLKKSPGQSSSHFGTLRGWWAAATACCWASLWWEMGWSSDSAPSDGGRRRLADTACGVGGRLAGTASCGCGGSKCWGTTCWISRCRCWGEKGPAGASCGFDGGGRSPGAEGGGRDLLEHYVVRRGFAGAALSVPVLAEDLSLAWCCSTRWRSHSLRAGLCTLVLLMSIYV